MRVFAKGERRAPRGAGCENSPSGELFVAKIPLAALFITRVHGRPRKMKKAIKISHSHKEDKNSFAESLKMNNQEKLAAVEFYRRQYFILKNIKITDKIEKIVTFRKLSDCD